MGLSREDALRLYGTEAATGWDAEGAAQNFQRVPEGGGYSSSNFSIPTFDPSTIAITQPTIERGVINIDDYINAIRDTLPEPPEEYMKRNPFWFDEQAATELATAEYSPYYEELLQDYLGDIKATSDKYQGDAVRTLADLDKQKEVFLKDNTQDFDKLIRGIKEGYSAKSLYFSGNNNRDQVESQKENANKLEGYLGTYGSKVGQTQADLNFQQQQAQTLAERKARDLARERDTAIAGQVNQLEDEAIDEWIYAMELYYTNDNWQSMIPPEPPADVPEENLPIITPPTEDGAPATIAPAPTEDNPEPVSAPLTDAVGEALPNGPPSVAGPTPASPALGDYTGGALGPVDPTKAGELPPTYTPGVELTPEQQMQMEKDLRDSVLEKERMRRLLPVDGDRTMLPPGAEQPYIDAMNDYLTKNPPATPTVPTFEEWAANDKTIYPQDMVADPRDPTKQISRQMLAYLNSIGGGLSKLNDGTPSKLIGREQPEITRELQPISPPSPDYGSAIGDYTKRQPLPPRMTRPGVPSPGIGGYTPPTKSVDGLSNYLPGQSKTPYNNNTLPIYQETGNTLQQQGKLY